MLYHSVIKAASVVKVQACVPGMFEDALDMKRAVPFCSFCLWELLIKEQKGRAMPLDADSFYQDVVNRGRICVNRL